MHNWHFTTIFLITNLSISLSPSSNRDYHIEIDHFEQEIFAPNPAKARALARKIPTDVIIVDEGVRKSLLAYSIDAALWYAKRTPSENQWYSGVGLTSGGFLAALVIAKLKHWFDNHAPAAVVLPILLVVFGLLIMGDSYFFSESGFAEMLAIVDDIMKKSPTLDAETEAYIVKLCKEIPDSRLVKEVLINWCNNNQISMRQ